MNALTRDQHWELVYKHMDAGTCYICGGKVEDFTAVHGLTGAHWNCTEDSKRPPPSFADLKLTRVEPVRPPGQFLGIAKGGHKVHVVDNPTQTSLCGHHPQSGGTHKMVDRSGWKRLKPEYDPRKDDICKECSRLSEGAL